MSKALQKRNTVAIVGMLVVAALAVAFWMLLLSPKREEAAKLGTEVEQVESSLAQHQAEIDSAEEARRQFPVEYTKLVVLGKAVPAGDETASLLVQVNGLADRAHVRFKDLQLSAEGSGEAPLAAPSAAGAPVSATEAAASLLPLGATIGPAGLAVMPYTLTFEGSFFQIADFIESLDAMVKTQNEKVTVDGRLITIGGFTLAPGEDKESGAPSSALTATFNVTTYLTPPGQGLTAGASPTSPSELSATPAATTTGGAP
jgi:Tfp pilus assembly protein PilO